jgi:phage baseplate assembly protein W
MLALSANSDYLSNDNFSLTNEYYDWDAMFHDNEIWGMDSLNQSIEMVLTTEPQERLFNPTFGTPLFNLLFENSSNIDNIMPYVYDTIEVWVPVKIDRANTKVSVDPNAQCVSFQIPYVSNNGVIAGIFGRRIYR